MTDQTKTPPAVAAAEFDDDRPIQTSPGELPPEIQAPLAPFKGEKPPAPAWFEAAIARTPERSFVTCRARSAVRSNRAGASSFSRGRHATLGKHATAASLSAMASQW